MSTILNRGFRTLLFAAVLVSCVSARAQLERYQPNLGSFVQIYQNSKSLSDVIAQIANRVSGEQIEYLKEQVQNIKRQNLGRIEIDKNQTIVIYRGPDVLTFSESSGGRRPASAESVFKVNGHEIEFVRGESIEQNWKKVSSVLAKSSDRPVSLFVRPAIAADFEPDELPISWMPSPISFAETRNFRYDSDGYFTTLTIAGVALLTSIEKPSGSVNELPH
jgi:hypothetical protein